MPFKRLSIFLIFTLVLLPFAPMAGQQSRPEHADKIAELKRVWKMKIKEARGDQKTQVLRYTAESKLEYKNVVHE
jgi:hypothetical protein